MKDGILISILLKFPLSLCANLMFLYLIIFKCRFECIECGVTSPLLPNLRRHYTKTHGSHFMSDCYTKMPIDPTLETWVSSCAKIINLVICFLLELFILCFLLELFILKSELVF